MTNNNNLEKNELKRYEQDLKYANYLIRCLIILIVIIVLPIMINRLL